MPTCNTTEYSSFQATTAQNLLLDAGAIFKNWVFGTDTYTTAKADGRLIGTTRGGSTFNVTADVRKIEADGAKGDTKGLQQINSWMAEITSNFLEISSEVIQRSLTNTTVDSTTYDYYEKITMSNYICNTDYLTNIAYVGKIAGTSVPIIIVLKNVLGLGGLTFGTADSSEAVNPITFKAHYDSTDLSTVPVEIYYPKTEGTVSGYISTGAAAAGTLTVDTLPTAADTMTVGATTYTFRADADTDQPGEISLGSGLAACQANIVAAINGTDNLNTANASTTIADFASDDAVLTAIIPGTAGNSIVTTETFTAVTNVFDAGTLGTTVAGSGTAQALGVASITIGATTTSVTADANGYFEELSVPYGTYTLNCRDAGSTVSGTATPTVVGGADTNVGVVIVS